MFVSLAPLVKSKRIHLTSFLSVAAEPEKCLASWSEQERGIDVKNNSLLRLLPVVVFVEALATKISRCFLRALLGRFSTATRDVSFERCANCL